MTVCRSLLDKLQLDCYVIDYLTSTYSFRNLIIAIHQYISLYCTNVCVCEYHKISISFRVSKILQPLFYFVLRFCNFSIESIVSHFQFSSSKLEQPKQQIQINADPNIFLTSRLIVTYLKDKLLVVGTNARTQGQWINFVLEKKKVIA